MLLRRYRIVRELAKGGMGVVYLARSEGAGGFVRPVVVKLILPEFANDSRFLGMFVREAKILSDLRHPSIVPVLEFGEEEGAYVMVLEYIRGYHVGQWNKYVRKLKRTIPAEMLLLLTIDVLEALHKAHSMSHPDGSSMHIVHRDVSPSNILLDEDGRARLLDFGVARMRGGNVEYQTQIQSFVGKFTYGAPELFGGTEATPQSDLYSAAVVLHEMLFGRNVFSASEDAMTLNLVLNHIPDHIELLRPDAPRGLDAVLQKALAKDPAHRYASAWEFAAALRSLQSTHQDNVRASIATMLRQDFGDAMARALGLDSLSVRDQAWREVEGAEAPEKTMMLDLESLEHDGPSDVESQSGVSHVRPSVTGRPRAHTGRHAAVSTGSLPRLSLAQPLTGQTGEHLAAPAQPPSNRALYIAMAVVGCLAATAVGLSLFDRAPLPPVVHVVAETKLAPPTAAVDPNALAEARAAAIAAERAHALSSQQARIDACFARKPRGQATPSSVEFEVDEDGKPLRVDVLPSEVANTSLARCLRTAAKRARFEEGPASFSIPLEDLATRAP